VLGQLLRGQDNKAIAATLDLTPRAVEQCRAGIVEKVGAERMAQLLGLALAGKLDSGERDPHLNGEGGPSALLRSFADAARTIVGAHLAAVAVFDGATAQVRWFHVSGLESDDPASKDALPADSLLTVSATGRRPRRLGRLPGDPELVGLPPSFPAITSLLTIPLATRHRVFGWLATMNRREGAEFIDEDERITVTLASQVMHALETDLLNTELQARMDQQREIVALAEMALGAEDLQILFDWATQSVARTLGVEFCSLLELDRATNHMVVRAGSGWPDGIVGTQMISTDAESLVGFALLATEPIVFSNLPAETRFRAAPFMYDCRIDSGLTVAIPGMTHSVGTLGAHTTASRVFTKDELDFARTVASILGQAIIGKQSEESLRRSQKMEAIGQLTGGIAHDFNNLLTVIIGNIQLALPMIEGAPGLRAIHEEIEGAARRGTDLTQRLLAFSRRQTLQPMTINLSELVFGMRDLLARVLGENIKFEVLADDDPWPAYADGTQVESALLNLAINAHDAMPDGGRLLVETRNAEIEEVYAATVADLKAGHYVVLSVTDTGIGMAPDVASRAFEPFFTTKGVGKGTGLGLSMVYGFAHQSGGAVTLDSEPGHGTVVKVYLPRAMAFAARDETARDRALPGGRETILVVEDDIQVRQYVVQQLGRLGYAVLQASNGPSALEILKTEPQIDLLFVDVIMPGGMNGFEVADAALQIRPGSRILLVSGFPDIALSRRDNAQQHFALLRKPFEVAELAQALRSVLEAPDAA
jgi:signal transduction histidine kinase/FixJ family two-component response regulator